MGTITLNTVQFPGLSDTYKIPPQAPEFSQHTTYNVNDFVTYQGVVYQCISEISSSHAWDPSEWSEVLVGSAITDIQNNTSSIFDPAVEYHIGDLVLYGRLLYRFIRSHQGAWSENDVIQITLSDEFAKKLDVDGYSALATVGNAEQLVSTVRATDKAPYLFRPAGGSMDIGNREYNTVVGGDVVHNQLVRNGNFTGGEDGKYGWLNTYGDLTVTNGVAHYQITEVPTDSNRYNQIRATGESPNAYVNWINGHKYLFAMTHRENMGDGTQNNSRRIRFTYVASQNAGIVLWTSTDWRRDYAVINFTADSGPAWYGIRLTSSTRAVNDWFEVKDVMIVDLTAMFGAEIADYVYTLETAEAGSGVAWLKSYGFLDKDYYATNSGGLISVKASAHETVGFNQWDEQWELGEISSETGENITNNNIIRSKNYIPIISGQTYYVNAPRTDYAYLQCRGYDANKVFLRIQKPDVNSTFVFDEDVAFIRFQETTTYGTEYKHDICINLSWSGYRNGEYEPYVKHSYPLDSTLTLNGLLRLDADNNLYFDGDIYSPDGTVTRWFELRAYEEGDESLEDAITDGTNTVVKLTESTTETAESFQSPQIVDDFGTERYLVPAQLTDFEMPVGHVTKYPANLRDKLQHLPDLAILDGIYVIQQSEALMTLVPLITPTELPPRPSEEGTYSLKFTVSGGTETLAWVADE